MEKKLRLLIVEDEIAIRNGLIDVFVFHGYEVDWAEEGLQGLAKAQTGQFDLVLLDVMLPGMNGFDICNKIREQDTKQPIIMLTAKSSDEDIIQGLTLGADDYVAKPFSVAQLVLRVQSVLRRANVGGDNANTIQLNNGLCIDVVNLSGEKNNAEIIFTRREMDVLQYLNEHSERPVSREELLHKVWGYAKNADVETRTVDIHIAKLRRKIEDNPSEPAVLVTVRGAGYRLLVS